MTLRFKGHRSDIGPRWCPQRGILCSVSKEQFYELFFAPGRNVHTLSWRDLYLVSKAFNNASFCSLCPSVWIAISQMRLKPARVVASSLKKMFPVTCLWMALRFNFQRELGSTSVAMCVKMEMKIVATSHRIWFSLPEHPSDPNKQAVDCLAVSVSAMDLSQSSSNPLFLTFRWLLNGGRKVHWSTKINTRKCLIENDIFVFFKKDSFLQRS